MLYCRVRGAEGRRRGKSCVSTAHITSSIKLYFSLIQVFKLFFSWDVGMLGFLLQVWSVGLSVRVTCFSLGNSAQIFNLLIEFSVSDKHRELMSELPVQKFFHLALQWPFYICLLPYDKDSWFNISFDFRNKTAIFGECLRDGLWEMYE